MSMFIFSEIGKGDIGFSAEKQPLQDLFLFSPYSSMHASRSRALTCECNVPAFLFLFSYELNLSFTALWTLIQPVTLFSILLTRNALPLDSVTSNSYICRCIFALRRGTTFVWRLKYERLSEPLQLNLLAPFGQEHLCLRTQSPDHLCVFVWVCALLNIFSNLGSYRLIIE